MGERRWRFTRFLRLSREDRRTLPVVALLLGWARFALNWASIARTRRMTARLSPKRRLEPERLADLVRVASQSLPGLTLCVPRAIVLEALLREAGHDAELRIGVAPRSGQRLDAHAWVEVGGVAVAEDPVRFTAVPLFGVRG